MHGANMKKKQYSLFLMMNGANVKKTTVFFVPYEELN